MSDLPAIAAALGAGTLDAAGALRALEPLLADGGADALALAGFCRLQLGDAAEAGALLDRALAREPGHWVARVNRAEARRAGGRWADAASDYRAALAARPVPELHVNLAQALKGAGDAEGERAALEEALRLDPASAEARNNLGLHHEAAGRPDEALDCFLEASRLVPEGSALAGDVAQNLGRALFERGRRLEEADPGGEAARRFYEDGIARHPDLPGLHLGLGLHWLDRCEIGKGEAAFARLLALCPDDPDVLTNYGAALERLGRTKEALVTYRKAFAAARRKEPGKPPPALLRWNHALVLLTLGRLREGFAEYETRRETGSPLLSVPGGAPEWDGRPFPGQTLLLYAEQGWGDAIQFIRYAALAKALSPAGTVVAACAPELARLFARGDGVDRVVVPPEWPERIDFHLPLMSLPRVFGTELETVPGRVPYFSLPSPPAPKPGTPRKIGLVWSGNPKYKNDRRRSCPLALIEAAGWPGLPGVEWHSFQADPTTAQAARETGWLRDRSAELTDFHETALRLRECDLVITVDTSVAHLAGALAVPVWVLLPFACDWRWLRRRADSPWYPTARLFRHPAEGDWEGCLAEATAALRERLGG